MNKAWCYIIFSKALNKFYIGATQDDLQNRIQKHNKKSYSKSNFTAQVSDWELYVSIPADDYAHAIRLERFIKAQKNRKFIEKLKNDVQMAQNIHQRFSLKASDSPDASGQ